MSDMVDKWGEEVAERGFAQIPNYLLLLNQFLGPEARLAPVELLVLIQLAGSWWKKEKLPFPSIRTLALRCGVSDRQINRSITRLESLNLLSKENRRVKGIIASNVYNLEPLVDILKEISVIYRNEYPRSLQKLNKISTDPELSDESSPGARPLKKPLRKPVKLARKTSSSTGS